MCNCGPSSDVIIMVYDTECAKKVVALQSCEIVLAHSMCWAATRVCRLAEFMAVITSVYFSAAYLMFVY